ncbi:MAG: helix-turn-helix domain-containing protein [Rivularia sp. ALOHA_DT_140]|nr:helix-turn-helix domain-containing protein [Rivularia sp. ALOHA_DT_140]
MDTQARQKLIEVIKLARGSMSLRAFGKELGVSATSVLSWEKGEKVPDTANLASIAARTGYTFEELLCHLEGKPLPEASELSVILKHINNMPLSELAIVGKAVLDRFAAESIANQAKAS